MLHIHSGDPLRKSAQMAEILDVWLTQKGKINRKLSACIGYSETSIGVQSILITIRKLSCTKIVLFKATGAELYVPSLWIQVIGINSTQTTDVIKKLGW